MSWFLTCVYGNSIISIKSRQLDTYDNNTYTYNASGIRTSKTVCGEKHTYALDGVKIVRETWGSNTLSPLYDNEEGVCGIAYNEVPYYFLKNLQGDVIAIVNRDGDTVARYSYDAWGKCSITLDNSGVGIATINPYRYRSYYYDNETGFYYLQSRYYDPEVGRFINADEPYIVCTSFNENLYFNLFAFAKNDPVNNKDILGFIVIPRWIIALIIDFIMSLSGIGFLFTPIKSAASTLGKNALKSTLRTPFTNFIKFLGSCISHILKFLTGIVSKIPFVGGWLVKIITKDLQEKAVSSIVGAAVSATVNKMLNFLIVNIDVLLSIGGFISGLCELIFDKEPLPLNGKIVV